MSRHAHPALPHTAFLTPRSLPRAATLVGRVAVLDIAFAAEGGGSSFEGVTLPFIRGLGDRLAAWVDHHDHERHIEFASDPRFVLATKAEHGACPEMVTHYLKLGYKLRELYREIERAESLGDAIALTPDYRLKAKKAEKIFESLVRDYREMRVAFHDQLATELRYAGCLPQNLLGPAPVLAVDGARDADASDPEAFDLEAADPQDDEAPANKPGKAARGVPVNTAPAAAGIWINLDNSRCTRPTAFAVDGIPMGDIPPKRRVTLRARAGTHELCILPEGDTRVCGEKGTVRRAYLYEGLTLTVHCEGK